MFGIIIALLVLYLIARAMANKKISESENLKDYDDEEIDFDAIDEELEEDDEKAESVIDYQDIDSIKAAYERGELTDEDIQDLYDQGIIDETEADFIDPDAVQYEDNAEFADEADERDDAEDYEE